MGVHPTCLTWRRASDICLRVELSQDCQNDFSLNFQVHLVRCFRQHAKFSLIYATTALLIECTVYVACRFVEWGGISCSHNGNHCVAKLSSKIWRQHLPGIRYHSATVECNYAVFSGLSHTIPRELHIWQVEGKTLTTRVQLKFQSLNYWWYAEA